MYTRPYCACIRVLICARIRVFICSCIRVLIARVYASLLRVYTRPYCARIRVFICSCIRVLIARVYASLLRAYTRLHLLVYTRPYCACIRVQKSRIHAFKMISEEIYARSKPMYNRTNFETNGLPYKVGCSIQSSLKEPLLVKHLYLAAETAQIIWSCLANFKAFIRN